MTHTQYVQKLVVHCPKCDEDMRLCDEHYYYCDRCMYGVSAFMTQVVDKPGDD